MPWLTTYQNVVFGPQLRGDMPKNELKAAAEKMIETVGLREFRDKYPLQLSGGMQRRAELARALRFIRHRDRLALCAFRHTEAPRCDGAA